jgi:methylmalonyl-CoA mutase cobalamin-binding subunit
MTARPLTREEIFPEVELPDAAELIARGRKRAEQTRVGPSLFLEEKGVSCEAEYKRRMMAKGVVMLHAQVGYRELEKTCRAYREIHERIARGERSVDRYGICLDWSMGYPAGSRAEMPQGTGLILSRPEDFAALTREAPVAAHFGDFVIGFPAAVENTEAALAAGSTAIGNLGQYFTFRLPYWTDDVATTAATVEAIALAAAQPVEILIHSNLDDGFAAQFRDVACALGAVLMETTIVENLLGGRMSHCYGHTYSDPVTRLAFQRALATVGTGPGTMVYGNTTIYGPDEAENFANLAGYLLVDIMAQRTRPTGHGINPVPVTEAMRIPDIDEIVDAHSFARRLIEREEGLEPLINGEAAETLTQRIVEGGRKFEAAVVSGLSEAGIDVTNPFEMLLALRRTGAKRLEALFGPGRLEPSSDVRVPVAKSNTWTELEAKADEYVTELGEQKVDRIRAAGLTGCTATTDVHEYGKVLVEAVLNACGVRVRDSGVSVDADRLAERAKELGADFIALSTYNGVALSYLEHLNEAMSERALHVPVFIGGKLNQIMDESTDSLPVDVSGRLEALGARACQRIEDMLEALAVMTTEK